MRITTRIRPGGLLIAALSLWALPGLAVESPTPPAPPAPLISDKELAPYKAKGHGSLTGQAFLGAPSGKAVTQAGVPIHLIPVTPSTKTWFERSLRATTCGPKSEPTPDSPATARPATDCTREALGQLLSDKRLTPALRTTRANPTGHFWFTKLPAGRYYLISVIEGGTGSHQEERAAGVAWLMIELEAGEKATNLVLTDCKNNLC